MNVCSELDSLKQELSACTAQVNQLRSELKHEQMQVCHFKCVGHGMFMA